MPMAVFFDALRKNMFHHAAISKRCRFIATDQDSMNVLKNFFGKLELHELTGTLSVRYVFKLLYRQLTRFPEGLVYLKFFYWIKVRGLATYDAEEEVLKP